MSFLRHTEAAAQLLEYSIMRQQVYVETSVVSYLTSRPSRDLIVAGHQQITHDWWDKRQHGYDSFISQLVLDEAGAGDALAAKEGLDVLQAMTLLQTTNEAFALAQELLRKGALPAKAADDALHIAIAATQSIKYLMTWNCRHMANATIRPLIESVCRENGLIAPIICTPEELLESNP